MRAVPIRRALFVWLVPAALLAGCLGERTIDERWTNVEILEHDVDPDAAFDLASNQPVSISAKITFRDIYSGAFVAELRASDTITPEMVQLNPDVEKIGTARDVDFILENTVTAGRDIRSTVGFDELIRESSFTIDSFVPLAENLAGPITGLFLVVYMGDEEEIELEDGSDSIVITPYLSEDYDILHKGIAVPLTAPPSP